MRKIGKRSKIRKNEKNKMGHIKRAKERETGRKEEIY